MSAAEQIKIYETLRELSHCDSFESAQAILIDFDPDKHPYNLPEWFHSRLDRLSSSGFMGKKGWLRSVITASYGTDGGGPFLGYRYYVDIIEALKYEVQMSLGGIFYLWKEPNGEDLAAEIHPMIQELSKKLIDCFDTRQSSRVASRFS